MDLGDDLATLVSTQNNPFEVIFPYLVSSSPLHALIFCFRSDSEHPTLTYSNDAADSAFWSEKFVTFCSSCPSVKLCRTNIMHIFLQIFKKNLMYHLMVMCSWSFINLRIIWQFLVSSSRTLATVAQFQAVTAASSSDHIQSPHAPPLIFQTIWQHSSKKQLNFHKQF